MKKDIFKRLILDSQTKDLSAVKAREIDIPTDLNKPVTLIGIRRSGKTYMLYSLIQALTKTVDRKNMLYINFEDDRLFPSQLSDLNLLLETYYELFPMKKNEKIFLFLDEIQNVTGWENFVRRVMDTENCRIFITGSSAKLLSKEIATSLRGRSISYDIFPLSFKEYLTFIDIDKDDYSSEGIAKIKNAFETYLWRGGFPEVINYTDDVYRRTLQEYLDLIMYKDMIERYNISNMRLLKYLIRFCFLNISKLISPNKLYNDMRSQGIKLSKNTLYEYLDFLEDSYGLFLVPIHSQSVSEAVRNPKKIYSIDTGFKRIVDYSFKQDVGYLYENIVFLELRREMKNISYYKKNQEVDFCFESTGSPQLINVSYDVSNPTTWKREITGMLEGLEYFSSHEGTIITADHEEELMENNKLIKFVPLWKWLLYRKTP